MRVDWQMIRNLRPRKPPRRVGCREDTCTTSGYTLIEMIIASVLVGTLMAITWGMMSMYKKYLTAGQAQTTERQLIRSLFQVLEDDLQSVQLSDSATKVSLFQTASPLASAALSDTPPQQRDPFDEFGATFGEGSDLLEEPSVLADLKPSAVAEPPVQIALTGNSRSLRVCFQRSPPQGNATGLDAANPLESPDSQVAGTGLNFEESREGIAPVVQEYQTILWQFQDPNVLAGASRMPAGLYRIQTDSLSLQTALMQNESLLESSEADGDGASVDRATLEALLFAPAETRAESAEAFSTSANLDSATSNSATPMRPQIDRIPEVVQCRFEYFGGTLWDTSWNSEQRKELPIAIRVRLIVVSTADSEKLLQQNSATESQGLPLEAAASANSTLSQARQATLEDASRNPLENIPFRRIDRIILLQPIGGAMPQSGMSNEGMQEPQASLGSVRCSPHETQWRQSFTRKSSRIGFEEAQLLVAQLLVGAPLVAQSPGASA